MWREGEGLIIVQKKQEKSIFAQGEIIPLLKQRSGLKQHLCVLKKTFRNLVYITQQ